MGFIDDIGRLRSPLQPSAPPPAPIWVTLWEQVWALGISKLTHGKLRGQPRPGTAEMYNGFVVDDSGSDWDRAREECRRR